MLEVKEKVHTRRLLIGGTITAQDRRFALSRQNNTKEVVDGAAAAWLVKPAARADKEGL